MIRAPSLLLLALLAAHASAQVRVLATRPLASFDATPTAGPASLAVQLADRSVGAIDSWTWDFGDGFGATVQNPSHTYLDPGTYSVTLTVSGPRGGDSLTRSDYVQVDPLPPGFVDELVTTIPTLATGFLVRAENDLIVWLKSGEVWHWFDGSFCPTPMADISEEVANWNDHGLHGFQLDPEYDLNGYVYLYYVVDRHHLDTFGTPAYDPGSDLFDTETIGRITRYTVFDPSDPATTIDPATRTVLVGEDASSGIPICSTTHGVGHLAFGHDGSLLFSCGDSTFDTPFQQECLTSGLVRPAEHVEQFRAQLVDCASGKILRVDPLTGDGHPSNPFFDVSAPRSWRSRVWALGLRNPYRFAVGPVTEEGPEHDDGPGLLLVGDVGNARWEELSLVTDGGQNFGWPFYEAFDAKTHFFAQDVANLDAPNPLYPQGGCEPFFRFEDLLVEDSLHVPSWPNPCDPGQQVPGTIPTFVHERPLVAWGHLDQSFETPTLVKDYDAGGNAIAVGIDDPGSLVSGMPFVGNAAIGGTWYGGTTFPAPYRDVYFHADFGERWIRAFALDQEGRLAAVHDFAASVAPFTFLTTDPDQDALYYLRYHSPPSIRRITYGGNTAPVAAVAASASFGPAPLRVELSAADSSDAESPTLEIAWDFGEGEPWTPLHELSETVHVYPSRDVTASVRSILLPSSVREASRADLASPAGSAAAPGSGPGTLAPDASVLTDGVYPAVGSLDGEGQVVVRNATSSVGYRLEAQRDLVGLIFQEGSNAGPGGGWLAAPVVEFLDPFTGTWEPVAGRRTLPPYPGDLQLSFETFALTFDPVRSRALRLRDASPGAGPGRFSAGELRVIALPDPAPSGPTSFVPSVTVTDELGAESSAAALVSVNNTPPVVEVLAPLRGQTYPVGVPSMTALEASVSDAEHGTPTLTCEWSIALVHDNHVHPEPLDTDCSSSFTLLPHNELQGDIIYWRVELRVTDPEGLTTTVVRHVIPEGDCNLNGIDDALDVDFDGDGVPDDCQGVMLVPERTDRQPVGGGR